MKASLKGPGLLIAISAIASFVSSVAVSGNSRSLKVSAIHRIVSIKFSYSLAMARPQLEKVCKHYNRSDTATVITHQEAMRVVHDGVYLTPHCSKRKVQHLRKSWANMSVANKTLKHLLNAKLHYLWPDTLFALRLCA
jgi:hypothetical protein